MVYKNNLNYIISFFIINAIIIVGIYFHKGSEQDYYWYFLYSSTINPLIIWIFNQNKCYMNLITTFTSMLYIIIFAVLFWDYKDKPWFVPKQIDCDECYGWFYHENKLDISLLIYSTIISSILAMIIKYFKNYIVNKF